MKLNKYDEVGNSETMKLSWMEQSGSLLHSDLIVITNYLFAS